MVNRLILVGYRGTGKTSIGRRVAAKLGYAFVDVDDIIVELVKKPIPIIFKEEGEAKFRDYETIALKKALEFDKVVISCGGGSVLREENRKLIKESGVVFLLKSSPEVIFKRIHLDSNRPSLTGKDPFEEIVELLKKRAPFYDEVKTFEIDSNKKLFTCVDEICEIFTKHHKSKK